MNRPPAPELTRILTVDGSLRVSQCSLDKVEELKATLTTQAPPNTTRIDWTISATDAYSHLKLFGRCHAEVADRKDRIVSYHRRLRNYREQLLKEVEWVDQTLKEEFDNG